MKNYGGAFDVDPYEYYTREDLDYVMSELNDILEEKNVRVTAMYVKPEKENSSKRIFDIDFTYLENEESVYDGNYQGCKIDQKRAWSAEKLAEMYVSVLKDAILEKVSSFVV